MSTTNRLPFTMKTVFQDLLLLTYIVPPDGLNALLPDYIHPFVYNDKSWISIVVGNMRGMRPAPIPEFLGVNYYQVVYRAVVCLKTKDGAVRPGVFFLRSDGNDPVMSFFGNRLTEFRFHYFRTESISLFQQNDQLLVGVETADKSGDLVMHLANQGQAETHPPYEDFDSVAAEKETLVQLFHAYAYDEQKQIVYDLEIERGDWHLDRLELRDGYSAFFTEEPFTKEQATPGPMVYIQGCDYIWKPMAEIPVGQLVR